MTQARRKLIEVALPLDAINRESGREKSIRHGHPSTLHLWWARRPLAACRAVIFAQLVDDPSSHPERFPTEEAQKRERQRLFELMERLVVWENAGDTRLFREANAEIAACFDGSPPAVLDPFAGGGSIPLEAKRLGLVALANDLNPLPVLLNTLMLELLDRFEGRVPLSGELTSNCAQALASDLRFFALELERRVGARLAQNYGQRGTADPLVYFWARTVSCPNPACRLEVPLLGAWGLSSRRGSEVFMRPVINDENSVDVEVISGSAALQGTMARTGGTCLGCSTIIPLAYVKAEGTAGRMGARMLAVQERQGTKRSFRPATNLDRAVAQVAVPEVDWLDASLSTHPQYMAPPRYGLTTFKDLFSDRQLSTLAAFVEELDTMQAEAEQMALDQGWDPTTQTISEGGRGALAYGEMMRILLALGIDRLVNRQSTLCIWDATRVNVGQVFSRQAYSMTWLYAEANPFAGASGSFAGQVEFLAKAIEQLPAGRGSVTHGPAQNVEVTQLVSVSTDPPYYDNVPYADLSDFFHVWLRKMLSPTFPELFGTMLSPKAEELVADSVRLGGKQAAKAYFEQGMQQVFRKLYGLQADDLPMTVFYAFKQTEDSSVEGATSTGWETMLEALVDSGWSIVGTWPMRTEQPGGLRQLGRNALASSIVIVCRKRSPEASAVNRRGFLQSLKEQLPQALRRLQQGSVAPVDLAQAAIGPGMAVFTQFRTVVEADGAAMTVRTALALINQVLDEVLSEQEGDLNSDSRFAVAWFTQQGWNEGDSGLADQLARAKNTSIDGLERGGIFRARAGRARLLGPDDLDAAWDPSRDGRICEWEVVIRVAKALDEGGFDRAAPLLVACGQKIDLDSAKELAYLLFALCEKKGWTQSALLFNALGSSWSDLLRAGPAPSMDVQSALTFDEDEE